MKTMNYVRALTEEDRPRDQVLRQVADGKFETIADDRDWYELDLDKIMPDALDHAEQIAKGELTTPLSLSQHALRAQAVTSAGWRLARETENPDDLTEKQREARAEALEVARLIFTAYLREQNGGPIGARIVGSPRWKL